MQIIGFTDEEILAIYQLLASILKLGNMKFEAYVTMNGTEGVKITNQDGKYLDGLFLGKQNLLTSWLLVPASALSLSFVWAVNLFFI